MNPLHWLGGDWALLPLVLGCVALREWIRREWIRQAGARRRNRP
jgi:hypothetical protein